MQRLIGRTGFENLNIWAAANGITGRDSREDTIHEIGIAENILNIVEDAANHHKLTKVTRVVIEIGQFSGVVVPSLEFAFTIITKDTMMEDAEIEIETPHMLLYCYNCETEYVSDLDDLRCPLCTKQNFEVIQGNQMLVKTIEGE